MNQRDGLFWGGAVVLSLLVHSLLFFNAGSLAGNQEQQPQERHTTRVSFRSATSPPTTPQALPVEVPPEQPEPEVTEAPEPPPEPNSAKEEMRAERARELTPQPLSEPSLPTPVVPTSTAADKVPVSSEAVSGTVANPALIEKAKQEYLRRLMAHIEKYKHYPRAAQRRNIEGDVLVSFTLQAGGKVTSLHVEGTQRVLSGAARRAVEEAMPLPEPPPALGLPWPVAFTMRFSLH